MITPEKALKAGELFIKEGLVTPEDIDMALSMQKKQKESPGATQRRLLGMILCDLNLITPVDNYYVLHKYNKLASIPSALVLRKILSRSQASEITDKARQQDIPLISYLLKSGLVSTRQMQKILFSLYHIPFRSISDFIFNQKDREILIRVIDQQRAEEHRIIPLVFKESTILFGITKPDNLLLIRQLNEQFPQYRFKALFIPHSGFVWFSKIIYGEAAKEKKPEEKPVDLSLLLSFKAVVKDPEKEKKAIWILYERYELLRRLMGKEKRGNFQDEFNLFIQKNHQEIMETYKSRFVEYSLKKNGKSVSIMAFPNQ